jgi:hypothetical protein
VIDKLSLKQLLDLRCSDSSRCGKYGWNRCESCSKRDSALELLFDIVALQNEALVELRKAAPAIHNKRVAAKAWDMVQYGMALEKASNALTKSRVLMLEIEIEVKTNE